MSSGFVLVDQGDKFAAELGKIALQAPDRGIAKWTEALARNKAGNMLHQFQVFVTPTTSLNAQENALQPARAFATGCTLATAFFAIEAQGTTGDSQPSRRFRQ